MKYEKEYQEFVKKITDKFISFTNGGCPPHTWSGFSFCDDMYEDPTDEEKAEFYNENNKFALQWLTNNMVYYDEWVEKYKKIDISEVSDNNNNNNNNKYIVITPHGKQITVEEYMKTDDYRDKIKAILAIGLSDEQKVELSKIFNSNT